LHPHDQYINRLLDEIESDSSVSQRSLAQRLGIALGLTNLLIRRLVHKGWVRVIQVKPNRLSYLLTPTGVVEKARMSRDSLQYSVRFYTDARKRIALRFATLSDDWPSERTDKVIAFFGSGEVAEIGYVCLQETDFTLGAVIDDHHRRRFFDVPLHSAEWLKCNGDGRVFERLVIMSFENTEGISRDLERLQFPSERVFWI
jgi:winged helix-turn-helix DNA-binding protein